MNFRTSFQTYWRIYGIHFLVLFVAFIILGCIDRLLSFHLFHNLTIFVTIVLIQLGIPLFSAYYSRRILQRIETKSMFVDSLTRLPSRFFLYEKVKEYIKNADADYKLALLYLDLDRFKTINDSRGYQIGDQLLVTVAERLQSCIGKDNYLARIGGDEFVVLLTNFQSLDEVESRANEIQCALIEPFEKDGEELFLTVSIGGSIYPTDGLTVELLIQHAETAMYVAKAQGRDQFQFYTSQLREFASERIVLENSLRRAMGKRELSLHYQPKVDIKTNRMIGMEALLRWNHGKLGPISPAKFIPVAEETGLIVPIGDWVLREACSQNKAWQDAGMTPIRVAVNLSAKQFQRQNLPIVVRRILNETGLEPQWLELEVTESVLMHNLDKTVATLQELKAMGIHISIDDFGTGYSSLSYLKRFPIDTLKIDQSFVRDLAKDPDDAKIVSAVISLAHSMKLKVIAEGVETIEQLEFLRDKNCDKMQGYYFSKPLTAESFTELLKQHAVS